MKCCICNSDNVFIKYNLYDDRYGHSGEYEIAKCSECKHAFTINELNDRQLSELYTKYYPRSLLNPDNLTFHKETDNNFKNWLRGEKSKAYRWVPKNVRILDIGCGFGETLGYHQQRGCDVYGVDLDENASVLKNKFRIKIGVFNSDDYEEEYFDYITMDQVLEHIQNPVHFLSNVMKALKPGGFIVIATPNVEGWGRHAFRKQWIHWHIPYHCQFFTKVSLRMLASKCNLKIIKQATITDSIWLHLQWMHLLNYPKITEPSAFWAQHLLMDKSEGKQKKRNIKDKLVGMLWRRKCNDFITRILDFLGVGDNILCILKKCDK